MPLSPYFLKENAHSLVKMVIIGMLVQLVVICYVFYQSYDGRKAITVTQRAGCERGKKDRTDNAKGWRIAQTARYASGDFSVARDYGRLASRLEARSRINCEDLFPNPRFFP